MYGRQKALSGDAILYQYHTISHIQKFYFVIELQESKIVPRKILADSKCIKMTFFRKSRGLYKKEAALLKIERKISTFGKEKKKQQDTVLQFAKCLWKFMLYISKKN